MAVEDPPDHEDKMALPVNQVKQVRRVDKDLLVVQEPMEDQELMDNVEELDLKEIKVRLLVQLLLN